MTVIFEKMANSSKAYHTRLQLQKDYANEIEHEQFINRINMSLKNRPLLKSLFIFLFTRLER